ncbi:MAG: ATP-binding cassette domain-containing protein [Herpetosiphonaceae bacterium]|nr:ATP-binding cassette domain-containing protein [Herpetosiphonaceae bacterium]
MQELAIETSDLTRHFGRVVAVNQLSLHVPTGSIYGFLGPNGAGKTTTIRMLLGLIRPSDGIVCLLGAPLTRTNRSQLAHVGALVETPSLYPHLTGYENLQVTQRLLDSPHAQIQRALEIVQLAGDAQRCIRQYSLGMRQRLGLALALLREPSLLILDEPSNGLDPAGIRDMRALIQRLATTLHITVFLSSHLLSEVEQIATHVGIINHGQLLFEGTLPDLRQHQTDCVCVVVDQPQVALGILTEAGWQAEITSDIAYGHNVVHVTLHEPAVVAAINALLVQHGLAVYELRREQPSLEDIFLQLTGDHSPERNAA